MPFGGMLTASLIGAGGNILGGIFGNKSQDWMKGGIGQILANFQNANQTGNAIFNQNSGSVSPYAGNNTAGANAYLWGSGGNPGMVSNILDPMQQYVQSIMGNLQGSIGQQASNPMMNGAAGNLGGVAGGLQPNMDLLSQALQSNVPGLNNTGQLAGQVFGAGGWTPQYQQGYDAISRMLNVGAPGSASSNFAANDLIGREGQTGNNVNAMKLANDVMSSGGWIPQLNMGLNPTQNILNTQGNTAQSNALQNFGNNTLNGMFGTGGLTPTGATAEAAGLQGVLGGGTTPFTTAAQQRGLQLMQQPALMNPAMAASLANNQSLTQSRQQFGRAMEQAALRGGGPGSITGGLQNEGATDFADQTAQNASQAVTQALQNQQQLQLQQQGQGTQMFGQGGNLENALLGTYGGIQGQNENVAANRFGTGANMMQGSGQLANNLFGTGLNMVPSLTNAAANYVSPYGAYGSNAMGNQASMLGQGANISNILQSGQLGSIGALSDMMKGQNSYALGMGGLQNSIGQGLGNMINPMAGTMGSLYGNIGNLGNMMANTGLSQFSDLSGAYQGGFGSGISGLNSLANLQSTAGFNPLVALAGQGMDLSRTALGSMPALFGGSMSQLGTNPMTGIFSGIGQNMGGMLGGLIGGGGMGTGGMLGDTSQLGPPGSSFGLP